MPMSGIILTPEQADPPIVKHKNISLTRYKCYRSSQFSKITSLRSTEGVQP